MSSFRSTRCVRLLPQVKAVVPELMLLEIAESNLDVPLGVKLQKLCMENQERVLVGKDSAIMIREQNNLTRIPRGAACINWQSTRFLTRAYMELKDWALILDAVRNSRTASNIAARKLFLNQMRQGFEWFLEKFDPISLNRLRQHQGEDQTQLIVRETSDPIVIREFVKLIFGDDPRAQFYLNPTYLETVSQRPNDFAIGRVARLVSWYCALHAAGNRKDHRNAIEDIQYTFLASYLKKLATEDKGMQRCAKALWPDIQLLNQAEVFYET